LVSSCFPTEEVVTSIIKEISRHFGESTATREETKLCLKDRQTLIRNKRVVYNIIYGQCSPSIHEVFLGIRIIKISLMILMINGYSTN